MCVVKSWTNFFSSQTPSLNRDKKTHTYRNFSFYVQFNRRERIDYARDASIDTPEFDTNPEEEKTLFSNIPSERFIDKAQNESVASYKRCLGLMFLKLGLSVHQSNYAA